MGALGILGGLAAAGAAYKEGQRNKKREERQEAYENALTKFRNAQAENLSSKASGPAFSGRVEMNDDPVATQSFAGRTELNDEEPMAQGGVVGYANGGLVDYNNCPAGERMYVGRVNDFVDSNWQRQSFKK